MSKLYSIGELLIDFQSIGGNSLKNTNQFIKNAGGAPANVCVQVAKYNQKAIYLTKVGKDGFGDFLIDTLKKENVDTTYISQTTNYETSLAFVSFKEEGEREFSFYRSNAADLHFNKADFEKIEFNTKDILEFGSVALKTKQARKVHTYLIKKAKKNNAIIAFDPNLRFNLWGDLNVLKKVVKKYIRYTEILKIGQDELEFIFDAIEENSINKVFELGVKIVLVTYGAKGAKLYLKCGKTYYNKGYKVDSVDTTAAGDSFFGSFLAQILEGNTTYEEMLDMACKTGAYTTTKYGAISAMGTKEQILKEIK